MLPHDGSGGWMPSPRKLSTDSSRMMPPTDSVVATMIGETTLGRMCTSMMRGPLAPSADRKSVVSGNSVSVRVDLGGSLSIKKIKVIQIIVKIPSSATQEKYKL